MPNTKQSTAEHFVDVGGLERAVDQALELIDSLRAQRNELLAVLKRAVDVIDADGIVYGNCDYEPLDVLSAAREAIARVEGRP